MILCSVCGEAATFAATDIVETKPQKDEKGVYSECWGFVETKAYCAQHQKMGQKIKRYTITKNGPVLLKQPFDDTHLKPAEFEVLMKAGAIPVGNDRQETITN